MTTRQRKIENNKKEKRLRRLKQSDCRRWATCRRKGKGNKACRKGKCRSYKKKTVV